jgi:hypothetical protein
MRTRAALISLALMLVLAPPAMATFPGGNGLLAVDADAGPSSDRIYVGQLGGGGLRALPSPCPPGPPDPAWDTCSVGAPVWSPDGARLAFTSIRSSKPQTWIVNADGSDLHQVPNAAGYSPAWSPDGTRLAFSVDAWDNQECHFRDLYTVNVDGSGLSLLTHHGDNPDWSVHGQIVYERLREYWTNDDASECEPQASLAVIRPGGQPRRVGRGMAPSWAPNGRAIAYSFRGGIWRKRIAAEGRGRRLLKTGAYEVAWSPNGRLIAYRRSLRLKLMGARRGLPRPIAFDAPGIDFSVDWQPLPR